MDDKPADVGVASLADPQQRCLPAGRVLSRHEAEPSRQVTRFSELGAVSRSRTQSRRDQRANPRDRHQAAGNLVRGSERLDLSGDVSNALLEAAEVGQELAEELPHRGCKVIVAVGNDPRHVELEHARALPDRDAELEAERPHLADQARPRSDHLIAPAMECLQFNLHWLFSSTKRIVGRVIASAIAAASIVSLLFVMT